jgi:hypothetical protein
MEIIMFTTALGQKGPARQEWAVFAKTARAVAVLGFLILISVAVNALTIFADSKLRRQPWTPDVPALVTDTAAGLA